MCIIVFKKLDNKNYLAKNRDKSVSVNISIIHEIVDNVEIVYLYDLDTCWIEGFNEFGIGFVHSTLVVDNDEIIDNKEQLSIKVREMLKHNNIKEFIKQWILITKNIESPNTSYNGHTLVSDTKNCIHIESFKNENPHEENILNHAVFTNHGIKLKNTGYNYGKKLISSLLRKDIVYNEIKNVKNKDEILPSLNKNYFKLNPEFHPYRNKKQTLSYWEQYENWYALNTTGQILMCLSELTFILNNDNDNCNFVKYDYRLPKNYNPKIKVIINKITKSNKLDEMPFDNSYIEKIYETYMFKKNTILFYCITLLLVLIIYIVFFDKL